MSNMLKRGKGNNFLVDISSSPKMDSLEDVDSVGAIYTHRRDSGERKCGKYFKREVARFGNFFRG